jgi:hypothetical protein
MSKTQILFAAITLVGLAGLAHADDMPGGQQSSTQPRYLSILPSSTACSACPTSGPTCAPACNSCAKEKGCLSQLWSFFTYRRLPYTDINTYCCSCCGPARPPLYVYMLHPCADKAAPLTLPDLSACGGSCQKCGRHMEQGCTSCPTCGK